MYPGGDATRFFRRNSAETQQSGLTPRSGPEIKIWMEYKCQRWRALGTQMLVNPKKVS